MESREITGLDKATKRIDLSSRQNGSKFVAFCFKVPFKFRQEFKLHDLQRGMTMTELLVLAVESYIDGNRIQPPKNTEIRK